MIRLPFLRLLLTAFAFSAAADAEPAAKKLPLPGEVFSVAGRPAFLIAANGNAGGKPGPWVWYAPTLPNLPGAEEQWMFGKFREAGIAIAGIDVGESYGSPAGRALFSQLYAEMTERRGYSRRPVLLGRSRGGLMTLSWAVENPDKVAAFAGIYPVCHIASYPGVAKAAPAYEMTPEALQAGLAAHNPLDRLAPLAKAGVPLFAIHGDNDKIVPLEDNSALLKSRYEALGGSVRLIVPPGQGHNLWQGFFQCEELVTFVIKHAMAVDDEVVLRRVADAVVEQTTRRLVDGRTGRTFVESGGLVPAPEIRIESKFNAWFYQTWLLADGMRRAAGVLGEPAFHNYGERNLDFIFQHMAFFERQHAAGMRMDPVGDGRLSPIGFYFRMDALWHTGLAPLVMERHAGTKDPRYEPYLERVTRFLEACPRFEDGAFYRAGKGMMTDDPFMTVPVLLRRWKNTHDARDLGLAIAQILGTHDRLFDRERGLLWHLWDLKTKQPAGVFWGRGNGWMVLAHAELLAKMPREHPRRGEVLAAFVRHMEGIRRCQDAAGGWHQVLNHPESWIETSCTGMFVYGLARGVNEGWLDDSFSGSARRGWEALKTKVTLDGDLVDVCGSTDVGDLSFYLNRPRLQGDLHGFGSFLSAGAEVLRMQKKTGAGVDVPSSDSTPKSNP